jgi:hypothetical protein
MNIVLLSRISEISESKTKFQRIKKFSSNWQNVIVVSILAMTLKVIAEQVIMAIR